MKKILLNCLLIALVAALFAVTVLNALSSPALFSSDDGEKGASNTEQSAANGFLLPEFIGAKGTLTGSVGLLSSKVSVAEVYSFLSPLISAAFTGGTGESIPPTLWEELIGEENTVYLRYHSELRAALISSHINGSYLFKGENPNVFEMLLVLRDSGENRTAYTLYTRSREGKLCRFTSGGETYLQNGIPVYFDAETFSRFSDLSGNSEFDYLIFQSISGIPEKSLMLPSQHILATPPAPSGLRFDSTEGELSSELLALLGFTPAGLGIYTDDTGATVYINTLGTLRRTADRLTFEAAFEGGIPLSVTENDTSAYSVLEGAYSAEALISELNFLQPELFGGDAYPMLTETHANGTALTLKYGYFFDNIMILSDDGNMLDITVTVENGKLTYADISLLNANDISYRIKNYPMFTVLRVLTPGASPEHGSLLRLAYRMGEGDIYTEWILETY
ncbi:MAG: hypothetical protein IJF74_02145 [Clostridia bacterium]|nr:hypothetical protein [Clostridia bacterium]